MKAPLESQLIECSRIHEIRFVERYRRILVIRPDGSQIGRLKAETLGLLCQTHFRIYVRFGMFIALVTGVDLREINLHIEIEATKADIRNPEFLQEHVPIPYFYGYINPTGIHREIIGSGPSVSSIRRSMREGLAPGSHTHREWRQVMARDGYRCLCCGSKKRLSKDHIQPIASGGSNDISNLQTLCIPCNSRKGNRTIDYRVEMAMTA